MICPHCQNHVHESWRAQGLPLTGSEFSGWMTRIMRCPNCSESILDIGQVPQGMVAVLPEGWIRAFPKASARKPAPPEVPKNFAKLHAEACVVLEESPRASAALSRRCLQEILHKHNYKGRDLAAEIQMLLDENDPSKGIPSSLRQTVDMVRHFGNFSAHPVTDKTSLQVIDVEPEEADVCLDVLDECFDHYYVKPEAAKKRRESLNKKLTAAGKPPVK